MPLPRTFTICVVTQSQCEVSFVGTRTIYTSRHGILLVLIIGGVFVRRDRGYVWSSSNCFKNNPYHLNPMRLVDTIVG